MEKQLQTLEIYTLNDLGFKERHGAGQRCGWLILVNPGSSGECG